LMVRPITVSHSPDTHLVDSEAEEYANSPCLRIPSLRPPATEPVRVE
jgi:hypothetical protein